MVILTEPLHHAHNPCGLFNEVSLLGTGVVRGLESTSEYRASALKEGPSPA